MESISHRSRKPHWELHTEKFLLNQIAIGRPLERSWNIERQASSMELPIFLYVVISRIGAHKINATELMEQDVRPDHNLLSSELRQPLLWMVDNPTE